MNFTYPLGLLGLIGVPILVIIYIIKNKYTEQTVTSTYIWTLSEKFLKRKNPINKLQKWISLVLQILAVVCVSFAIAHPTLALAGRANDYCFVLDGSGSMAAVVDGESRFDRAKKNIENIIRESKNGSTYTLICASETSAVLYHGITDKEQAIKLLADAEASGAQADFDGALESAQEYFDETPSAKIYFMTDGDYKTYSNVEIVNVAAKETNYALVSAECSIQNSDLVVKGKIAAYGGSGMLTVSVYVDDAEKPAGQKTVSVVGKSDKVNVSLNDDELASLTLSSATGFEIKCESVADYQSVRVVVENKDAIASDNEIVLYNVKHGASFDTLIVSEHPFFLKSILNSLGHRQIDVMAPEEYDAAAVTGLSYGLYIFDEFTPAELPSNGAVWFFAPSATVANSGFAFQTEAETYEKSIEYSNSSKSEVKKLLEGLDRNESLTITDYNKYSTDFLTLLTCEGSPVVFVGNNGYNNREVVFAFSLNRSDVPLTYNYIRLVSNLLGYTFPQVIDEANYFCGDVVDINVLANTQSIKVVTPSGEEEYLSTEAATAKYTLAEVGLYSVKIRVGSGNNVSERTVYMYSEMPYSESATVSEANSFSIVGTAVAGGRDGIYDNLLALFIILAVIFVADWMVYCYEQYQLR